MKLTTIPIMALILYGPNHKTATSVFLNSYEETKQTITTATGSYQNSQAIYGYYNEDSYFNVGPLRYRAKTIVTGIIYNQNQTAVSTHVDLSSFTYVEIQNPQGYAYQGTITFNGNTNIDPQAFDYAAYGENSNMNDTAGYNFTLINNAVYQNKTTVLDVNTQIWTDIYTTIENTGMGWDEEYDYEYKANNEESYRNIINSYQNSLTGRWQIESETGNTDTKGYARISSLKVDRDYLTEFEKQTYINTLVNQCTDITIELNYVGPNATQTVEVIDIPGLMFTILGMPFAWISTAFNLTLFPGTPYVINISHIVLAIIAASILIFLIKKVLK